MTSTKKQLMRSILELRREFEDEHFWMLYLQTVEDVIRKAIKIELDDIGMESGILEYGRELPTVLGDFSEEHLMEILNITQNYIAQQREHFKQKCK